VTAVFTPGGYIAARRCAAGYSIEDVAALISTEPHMAELDRRAWLALIEADDAPIAAATVDSLRAIYPFDREVLERLADLHWCHAQLPAPRLCRSCACSEHDACLDELGRGYAWATEDLCTECAPAAGALASSSSVRVPAPIISASRGAS
jgi:hypothetical protein